MAYRYKSIAGTDQSTASPPGRTMGLFGTAVISLIVLTLISSVVGYRLGANRARDLLAYGNTANQIHYLQQALVDAETGIRGLLLSGDNGYLQPYFLGVAALDRIGPAHLAQLDDFVRSSKLSADAQGFSRRVAELREIWTQVVALAGNKAPAAAIEVLRSREQKRIMDELRGFIAAYLASRAEAAAALDAAAAADRRLSLAVELAGGLIAICALLYSFRRSVIEIRQSSAAIHENEQTARRLELLFGMTSMLQTATERQDAYEILRTTAVSLLPDFSGALYVLSNSKDRLEQSLAWGPDSLLADHILPANCWGMKFGHPHVSGPISSTLRCQHLETTDLTALEIPMNNRGQVFGLLLICDRSAQAIVVLQKVQSVAVALADAMSLALANMALRDLLRNQAIRDSLTGLYNRRFLDEMLEHLNQEAKRRQVPLSLIMIDLDHFKRVNDEHGHGTGDTVLREVSALLVTHVRASDVVCRFGGEELVALLPDCSLDDAVAKAEQLRAAIFAAYPAKITVTASFGVATIPDTSSTPAELMEDADAALYQAKLGGRNRVMQATAKLTVESSQGVG